MPLTRRDFLRYAVSSSLAGATLLGMPSSFTAHAAQAQGYKALVCVFLFGGVDGYDILLPYDHESYNSFANIRQSLLNQYQGARSRENLQPLTPDNAAQFGSREFALPPEMPMLKSLFDQRRAAIVSNVGPLIEPVSAQSFANRSAKLPPRLFSHNDQQSIWQASAPEGAQFGWGGLFADAILAAGANTGMGEFTTLSTAGVGPFLTGNSVSPYQISLTGSADIAALQGASAQNEFSGFLQAARDRFRAEGFSASNILAQDIATKFRQGIDANTVFDLARLSAPALTTPFPATLLGGQLKAVADTISIRDSLSANRQIFFVGIGGFDTHSNQAEDLSGLLSQLDNGLAAFDSAMIELGLSESVTTFTASDFGRTLTVNGDGTDHGWGGNQIVMGGAVRGGNIFGDVPPLMLGHDLDAGNGRLIPSLAVEQLAAPLGQWWGLSNSDVLHALPGLSNFDPADLALF
ncbi:DUF1501 domain-containing protein [Alteromonas sp. ASW11-36]|uniref:DUF1501 domain-containing protein n=1 Tax=Alteromonas arenosi TaxID=3055817 RepID=A0ABT7SWT8_9ALTE|nr:DUF1501 domain-containing protein [Alteromonas sp. ASW11-36]MDM7860648.1 DUF1501 domain-containing protein [Alteromonas sp. ASW11-36]